MTSFASTTNKGAGFTIVEALIVLLIGSTLLSVLTPMMLSATQVQQKISTTFSERSDWLFFESQMSVLVQSFEDPSLRKPKIKKNNQPAFEGSSKHFSGTTKDPFGLSIKNTENLVWVGWLSSDNPPNNETDITLNAFGKLAARIGNQWIIWPQSWTSNATFSYIDQNGNKHLKWPPDGKNSSQNSTKLSLSTSPLPYAIVISDDVSEQERPHLYTYNLKL